MKREDLLPCKDLGERCDPCEQVAKSDKRCSEKVKISYTGLLTDTLELRNLIGSVGDDPFDPAGFIDDDQLKKIIDRNSSAIQEAAQRSHEEQCNGIEKGVDEQIGLLDEALAMQETQRQVVIQALKAQIVGLEEQLRIEIDTAVESFHKGLPTDAAEYFDEVKIFLEVSPTTPESISYGIVEEDYIVVPFGNHMKTTAVDADGNVREYTVEDQLFEKVQTSFFPLYRCQMRGRYIYFSNNGVDLQEATVWLTTEERIKQFAEKVATTRGPLEEAKEKLRLYEENPTTDSDGLVFRIMSNIKEMCSDPVILSGDVLAAPIIQAANDKIIAEARREVEFSSGVIQTTKAQSDEK